MRKRINLNGIWNFSFLETRPEPESLCDFNCYSVMPVPGCFDVMTTHHGKHGFGIYKRKITTGGLVELHIDGLGISGQIWWDGQFKGECKYAYMPETFVFDAGPREQHELIIIVDNNFNDIFFPFFDFHAYGGIYGDVSLEELPSRYIDQVKISTTNYQHGEIKLDVIASQIFDEPVAIQIQFDDGEILERPFSGGESEYALAVPDFKLWSPDEPNLHRVTVRLLEDEVEEIFGIREISTDGNKLLLNGSEIFLMGYNRHESHPQFGAATPPSLMIADLQLIKDQGCNFVRGSHYPQRKTFLELCDRLGILVWEETLGWDVKPPELFSDRFLKQQKDQARKMVQNDFNHPCIIIWGFLNETESQMAEVHPIIEQIYATIRQEDSSRLITYASNKYEKDCCTDLVDIVAMNPYPGWGDANWEKVKDIDNVRPRLEKLLQAMPKDKPVMISETGAGALYGFHDPYQARWSEEYQAQLLTETCSIVLNSEAFCGLSIWQFCDAKSYINGHVVGRPGGFNNKGILDPYRRPKMAWNAIAECIKKAKRH